MPVRLGLARVAFWEHDFLGSGVERGQDFWNQAALDRTGFSGSNEITNDRVDPGDLIHSKDNPWMLAYFELIHRSVRQQFAIRANALDHFFANLFGHDSLHRFGDEFQIAL